MDDIEMSKKKKQTIEKYTLDHKDSLLLKQLCIHPSTSLKELGDLVGMSKTAVSKRLSKPEFKRVLEERQESTADSVKRLVNLSCARLKLILEGDDPKLALEAAKVAFTMYSNLPSAQDIEQSITYAVRFGEQGQMFREIRNGQPDDSHYPTTLELMQGQIQT